MVLKYLIQKEFLQIRRNTFLPKLIFIFPVVIMCVIPWVMNMEVKSIIVDVVDNDRSTISQQLVHSIEASKYFVFNGQKISYKQALEDVERCQADVIVEIPYNYSHDLMTGANPQVLIAANAVNGTKGSMGSAYLSNIVAMNKVNNSQLTIHNATMVNQETHFSTLTSHLSTLYLYNKNLNYKLFMIPALMAILIMLLCGFLPALNIVGEKETGTIEAVNVTPISKCEFILAKLIPYWIIGMIVMTICFILSWAVYGITSVGSLWLIYLISILLAFIFSGIGLIISNYNESMQQAVFVMWFVVVNLMLLSGLFTPARSMPHWAFMTTYVNPMTFFVDAIRTVFVRGGDFQSIAPQVLGLAIFALVMDTWAVISYRKNC